MWLELVVVACLLAATGTTTPITVVISGSMEPALGIGAVALIQNRTDPVVGDIIVFDAADTRIIHRVIDVDSQGCFQTMGDANTVPDRYFLYRTCVPRHNVSGTLLASVPLVGYPFVLMSRPALVALVMTLTAAYKYCVCRKRGWDLLKSLLD
jgi:signal peptidase